MIKSRIQFYTTSVDRLEPYMSIENGILVLEEILAVKNNRLTIIGDRHPDDFAVLGIPDTLQSKL